MQCTLAELRSLQHTRASLGDLVDQVNNESLGHLVEDLETLTRLIKYATIKEV